MKTPLFALLVLVGCYRPDVVDGGLRCSPTYSCPDGFACETASGYCRRHPNNDAGHEVGDSGADAREAGTDAKDAGPLKLIGEFCTIMNQGLPSQTDDCGAGLACIEDGCNRRCYKRCGSDGDCTNSTCSREVSGGLVCDVPFVDCSPVGMTSGCAGSMAVACYLSSSTPTRTICDCPFNAVGANSDCAHSRDCIRGLACVDRGGRSQCLQVCRIGHDMDCPGGLPGSCHPYTGSPAGTDENQVYGYCF